VKQDPGRQLVSLRPAQSPWAQPWAPDDPGTRVVGWRNGAAITRVDQERILKSERQARREYLDAKKAIAGSQASESTEGLSSLPASWQAFWATVPGLDAQAAFKLYTKERDKKEQELKQQAALEDDEALLPPAEGEESVQEEVQRLTMELRRRKEELANKKSIAEDWERKLNRVRALDKDEEEDRRSVSRRLDKASYAHGVLEGKIRSSDQYFRFLFADTQATHKKRVTTLTKANVMMQVQINEMKNDVRQLLKVAAEALPQPPEGGSLTEQSREDGSHKLDAGAASGTDDEGASSVAHASATGKASGKPAP